MAKYSAIKAAVNAYIKQNGRKEITGKILNAVLNATIDSLGKFYQFAGEALPTDDPGTPDQNLTYLAGTAGTYTNFGGLTLDTQEIALLMWDGEWKKQTLLFGIQEVDASVDNQVGTPSVDVDFVNNVLTLSFHNIKGDKGDTGDPAGFGQVTASVDDTIGNPSVQVQTSGEDTAKNIAFEFHGLRGETGITSVVVSVDNTTGNPACSVSLVGQVLHLDFTGLKGLKGDTGVSADYPITIYNGLDSDATDQALSAAQGKVLDGKVSQLGQKVDKLCKENGATCLFTNGKYIDLGTGIGNAVSLTPQSNPSFQYSITPCEAGDIVSVTAMGGATSSRTWGFIDANNILLSVADAPGVQLTDEKLTAPANAAFVVINTKTTPNCYVIAADNIPAQLVPFTNTKNGFVPAPNGNTGFLKSDGTWANPTHGGTTAIIDGNTYPGVALVASGEKKLSARVSTTLTLDSVAYEGKTYREIFETGNELGINPGFDNGSYSPLVLSAGNPTIVSDVYDTAPNSLKCYGTTSQQLKTSGYGPINSNVFLAFRGYCTRYASGGGLGVILGSWPARLNEVTTGFVTRSAIVNANGGAYNLYVGTYQTANCDGYIDSPVAIDLSMFTNEPTLVEMTALYETYLSIKKGEQVVVDVTMIDVSEPEIVPTVAKAKFVSAMNEYAKQAGMVDSTFTEPSGVSLLNQSTAEDICRLALVCCANDKLQQYWGWETYTVNIMGENARTQVVTNTYKGTAAATLASEYHIFGGKSGTLSYGGDTHRNLFSVVKSKVDDSWLVGCIMLSTLTDRFKPMKDLFDWLEQKRANPSVADPTLDCSYACAGVVPNGNPCAFRDVDWMLCKYSATTQQAPFSMTKILTALVALDYCKPDEIIEVKASDVDIYGSGNYFQDGDKLTFREAIIAMMLPSSNTLANTIARVVGTKIITMNG